MPEVEKALINKMSERDRGLLLESELYLRELIHIYLELGIVNVNTVVENVESTIAKLQEYNNYNLEKLNR